MELSELIEAAEALYQDESKEPIILGIDPAIASIGFGVIQGNRAIDYGVISTNSKTPLLQRYDEIYKDVQALCVDCNPDKIALEMPFFGRENTNAWKVVSALGVILVAISHLDRKYSLDDASLLFLHQSQVKSTISHYGASKKTMKAAVMQLFDLPTLPRTDDEADGLAIAYAAQQGARANIK